MELGNLTPMELARPLSLLSWELGTWNLELGICSLVRSDSERMNWISHDGKLCSGTWNLDLGFCFHVRKLLSILGHIPSSRFQVPTFKARQQTKHRVFQAPSELWNLELGTWKLDFAASQSKFQTPLGPTADSKFPEPTSRKAPRNKASSKRTSGEGKIQGS